MVNLADISAKLKEPFAMEDIGFLPKGQFEKNGQSMITGLPFADKRVYEDRLNEVCPGEWSTPNASITVAGNKIITLVTVIICGVPHTDVGEAAVGENAGTESFAQAFKRACSQAGVGRYLYDLDKAFLPYNKDRKRIDLDANGLRNEVRKLYAKAGLIAQRSEQAATTTPKPAQAAPKAVEQTSEKPAQATQSEQAAPVPTVSQLRKLAAKHLGVGAFNAIIGTLKATYPNASLDVDDAWEEKHCKHAYDLLKKQINERKSKQPAA